MHARPRRRHALEPLEPRILLSADLSYVALADADLTLRLDQSAGSEILQLVDTQDPSIVLASQDLSAIDGTSGFGARIDANGHAINLTLDGSIHEGMVRGGILFQGGAEDSSVRGPENGAEWHLTGNGAGRVADLVFTGVRNVKGGGGADTFVLAPEAQFSSIEGGSGNDVLRMADPQDTTGHPVHLWLLRGEGEGSVDGQGFRGFETLEGSTLEDRFQMAPGAVLAGALRGGGGQDTLFGPDADASWILDATGRGAVNGVAFEGIETLAGGSGRDVFALGAAPAAGTLILGGEGTDTLRGSDRASRWSVRASNAGEVDGTFFAGVESLAGGAGDDQFAFDLGGALAGAIDGGAGRNALDYSLWNSPVDVNLSTGTASGTSGVARLRDVTGGRGADRLAGNAEDNLLRGGEGDDFLVQAGADQIEGGGGIDRLVGPAGGQVWLITGDGSGEAGGSLFSGIESLEGGVGADRFVVGEGARLPGRLQGGGGADTLDLSGRSQGTTIDLASLEGIGRITGGSGADTLLGPAAGGAWRLLDNGEVEVNGTRLAGIESLVGGAGLDVLTGPSVQGDWLVEGPGAVRLGPARFSGIERLQGASPHDTLRGPSSDATWKVTGQNLGQVAGLDFFGFENLEGAAGNRDTFVFGASGQLSGTVEGGDLGFDSVVVEGSHRSVVFRGVDPHSGSVRLDAREIRYGGMEPITLVGPQTDVTFETANPGVADTVVLKRGSVAGTMIVEADTTESLTFENPSNSLTIRTFAGNDSITIESLDPGFTGAITLEGGSEDDTYAFAGKPVMTGSPSLSFNDVALAGNPSLTFRDVALTGNPSLTFIDGGGSADTIVRGAGDWLADGFRPDQTIKVVKGGSANDNQTFTIDSVNATTITLKNTDVVSPEGPANGYTVTGPDTIQRAAGSWIADGIVPGHEITVDKGGSSNNGTFTVASVEATFLTLEASETLTNEGPANGYTLSAHDTITRNAGSWVADGFTAGQTIVVRGAGSNNGVYTIDSVAAGTLVLASGAILADANVGSGAKVFSPFGDVTVTDAGGSGDKLDFGPYQGVLTLDLDGTVHGGDPGSSVAHSGIDNLIGGNIDITGSGAAAFKRGLEKLEAWAEKLEDFQQMGKALASLAGVNVGDALDISESINHLRAEIRNFIDSTPTITTDDLKQKIQDFAAGALKHLDRAIVADLFAPDVTTGTFTFKIQVDGGTEETVTVSGITQLAGNPTLSFFHDAGPGKDSITRSTGNWADDGFAAGQTLVVAGPGSNNGTYTIDLVQDNVLLVAENLTSDPNLAGKILTGSDLDRLVHKINARIKSVGGALLNADGLPLVQAALQKGADAAHDRFGFQAIDPAAKSLQLKGLADAASRLGFAALKTAVVDVQKVVQNLGDLSVDIAPGVTLDVAFGNMGVPELRLNLHYDADRSTSFRLDLGEEGETAGVSFDATAKVEFDAALNADLALGLRLSGSPEFFLDVDGLDLEASVAVPDLDASANVGFLGVDIVNGTLNLDAGLDVNFSTSSGISEAQLDAAVSGIVSSLSAPTASLAATLPFQVKSGLGSFNPAGISVTLTASDPFVGREVDVAFNGDFTSLVDFNDLTAAGFMGMLGQLRDWMNGLKESQLLKSFPIPFASGGVGKVLNLADALGDSLLFDDGDDGADGSESLLGDINQTLSNAGIKGIQAGWNGTRIVLVSVDSSITSFSIEKLSGTGYDNVGFNPAAIQNSSNGVIVAQNAPTGAVITTDAKFRVKVTTSAGMTQTDVTLVKTDTDANEKVGNDLARLLDKGNAPTFKTAQDLAHRLLQTIGLPGSANYDPVDRILSYTIDLSHELIALDVPVDFGFDLGPIASVNTAGSPKIRLDGSVDFHVTLGVKLGAAGGSPIAEGDQLTSLKNVEQISDVIQAEFGASPATPPSATMNPGGGMLLTFADTGAVLNGNPQLTFDDGPKTVTRSAGSWLTDGFRANQRIKVTGTTNNNATFTIASLNASTLTLSVSDTVADEVRSNVQITGSGPALSGTPNLTFNAGGKTITRSAGSWITDGFVNNQYITVTGSGLNDGTYKISNVIAATLTLSGSDTLVDETNAPGVGVVAPDTISRSSGSWVTDGFRAGQLATVTRSARNNGAFVIEAIKESGALLVLSSTAALNDEGPVLDAGVTGGRIVITGGAVVRLSGDAELRVNPVSKSGLGLTFRNIALSGAPNITFANVGSADTITRAAGSWITDGFAVGQIIRVGSGIVLTGNPDLSFANVGSTDTITRSAGSWLTDGFAPGKAITVSGTASNDGTYTIASISGNGLTLTLNTAASLDNEAAVSDVSVSAVLANAGVYEIASLTATVLTLTATDTLSNEGPVGKVVVTSADTITRAAGNWLADGFMPGKEITLTGTLSNNGTFRIAKVSSNGLTLTLDEADELTAETAVAAAASAAYVVRVLAGHDDDNPFVTDTAGNNTLLDLVLDIGSSLERAGLQDRMEALADGSRLILRSLVHATGAPAMTFADAGSADTITRATGSWIDDGFEAGQKISVSGTNSNNGVFTVQSITATVLTLTPGASLTAEAAAATVTGGFTLEAESGPAQSDLGFAASQLGDTADIVIVGNDGVRHAVTLDGARTIGDVLARINAQVGGSIVAEINPDGMKGLRIRQQPALTGAPRLTFDAASRTITRVAQAGNTPPPVGNWVSDGFVMGQTIRVTGSQANDGVYTIQMVSPTVLTLSVAAVLHNEGPTKNVGVSGSGNGTDSLRVEKANGSPSALRLGIWKADADSDRNSDMQITPADGDGLLIGESIGGGSLLDRFFIQDPKLAGSLTLETPDGITVGANFGIVSVALTGDGSFDGKVSIVLKDPTPDADEELAGSPITRITLAELIDGLSDIGTIVDTPKITGTAMTGTPTLTFNGMAKTIARSAGNWTTDGFTPTEHIQVLGSSSNDGIYEIQSISMDGLTLTLTPAATLVSEAGSSNVSVIGEMGEVTLDLTITPDISSLVGTGASPQLRVTLFDLGDPFFEEMFTPIFVNANSFTLSGNQLSKLRAGDKVSAELGGGTPVSSKVASLSYNGGMNKTTVTLADSVLTMALSKATFTREPSLDIQTPDLGDLTKFKGLSIGVIIDALRALSQFLGQFESFAFLSTPIPVLNVSFNDVLAFADKIDAAVTSFEQNPAGTLQLLTDKLKEALGLPADAVMNGSPKLTFNVAAKTIVRSAGSWIDDGFVDDQTITIGGPGSNNGTFIIDSLTASTITLQAVGGLVNASDVKFKTVRGTAPGPFGLDLSLLNFPLGLTGPNDVMRFDFDLGKDFSKSYPLDFDLGDAGILTGSAGLVAQGSVGLTLAIGIDLNNPLDIYLFEDTAIKATFLAGAPDIDLQAAIGPFGAFIKDGLATIGGGPAGQLNPEILRVGLDFDDNPGTDTGKVKISDVLDNLDEFLTDYFSAIVEGELHVNLPVYFPTASKHVGSIHYDVLISVDEEGNFVFDQGSSLTDPEPSAKDKDGNPLSSITDLFQFKPGEFSLLDNILLLVDGVDFFLGGIQDVLDGEVFGFKLPLIGDQLSDGARVIEDFREGFLTDFREAVENAADPSGNFISQLLFDLLGSAEHSLVADVNTALAAQNLDDVLEARAVQNTENNVTTTMLQIVVKDVAAAKDITRIELTAAGGSIAVTEMGFQTSMIVNRTATEIVLEAAVPGMTADGVLSGNGVFGIKLFKGAVLFRDKTVTVTAASTSDNERVMRAMKAALGVLLDQNGNAAKGPSDIILATNLDQVGVALKDQFIQWDLKLGDSLISDGADLGFDLGVPALKLESRGRVQLDIDWELDLSFGLNGTDLFFIDVSDPDDLKLDIEVTLPDAGLTGNLFFLQFNADAKPETHLSASFDIDVFSTKVGDETLGLSELGKIGLDPHLQAEALIDLALSLQINPDLVGSAAAYFPKLEADFLLDWGVDDILSGGFDSIQEGLHFLGFKDVRLDLGSFISEFISPVLGEIKKFTEPVQPIIDVLTTPIPVVSDLLFPITLLDLAASFGDVDPSFIHTIADVISLINSIPTDPGENLDIPFGDFVIFSDSMGFTPDLSHPVASLSELVMNAPMNVAAADSFDYKKALDKLGGGKATEFAKKAAETEGFSFPILSDPQQAFKLLTGDAATLLLFDLPILKVDFSYTAFFPIYGPLGIGITFEFQAKLDFHQVGFDTQGIIDFANSGFKNPLLVFNGFFLNDNGDSGDDEAELSLYGRLSASAELNLGIARAGVAGGIGAEINFDLFDPNHDGKIRISEIIGNFENEAKYGSPILAPLAIFDVTGRIFAELFAFLIIDFGFFSVDLEFPITPKITLADFQIDFFRPPKLASVVHTDDGDILQLNMGKYSKERLNQDLTDFGENFTVTGNASALTVSSNIGGTLVDQEYEGSFTKVLVRSGEGDDVIDLSGVTAGAGLTFDIETGAGNDIVKLGAGAMGKALIKGQEGDDSLEGGGGDDIIFGGLGADDLKGGGGVDWVFGDDGKAVDEDENGVVEVLRAKSLPTDSPDTIHGGAGADLLFGGGGDDRIYGDAGADLILGDTGLVTVNGLAVDETNRGLGGGKDILLGGADGDRIYGGLGDDLVDGGLGDDFIYGEGGIDVLLGGSDDDHIEGGTESSFIHGWRPKYEGTLDFDHITMSATTLTFADNGNLKDTITRTGGDWRPGGGDGFRAGQRIKITNAGVNNGEYTIASVDEKVLTLSKADRLKNAGPINGATIAADDIIRASGNWSADGYGFTNQDIEVSGAGSNNGRYKIYSVSADGRTLHLLPGATGLTDAAGVANKLALTPDADTDDNNIANDGDDTLLGADLADVIHGGGGDDEIHGGEGVDQLFGGTDDDELFGEGGFDILHGGADHDVLDGGDLADQVFGDAGDDELLATLGDDFLDGGGGGDQYFVKFLGGDNRMALDVDDSGLAADGVDSLVISGTSGDDRILLRASTFDTTRAFVANLNGTARVERVDYRDDMETIKLYTLDGDDFVALDDVKAAMEIFGGYGNDRFQIGQLFKSERTSIPDDNPEDGIGDITGITDLDQFSTIETTRGWLSNGISVASTISGDAGDDNFIVFHNKAVLTLLGGDDDDTFIVRAFALAGSQDQSDLRERTDISGNGGADLIQYVVNAPVNIDGGDGFDTVIIIGTEFGDDFVVTEKGIFGAGLNVNFVGVEVLNVDGAEGDDRIFVQGTSEKVISTISGGLGSDTFSMAGDTPPVVSNDLLGHSGIVSHHVDSSDPAFDDIPVDGISANVADNDEPGIVIRLTDGFSRVIEDLADVFGLAGAGFAFDSYSLALTRQPEKDVTVSVIGPTVPILNFEAIFGSVNQWLPFPLLQFEGQGSQVETTSTFKRSQLGDDLADALGVDPTTGSDPVNEDPDDEISIVTGLSVTFTPANWATLQVVRFRAVDDSFDEGSGYGTILHKVQSEDTITGRFSDGPFMMGDPSLTFKDVGNADTLKRSSGSWTDDGFEVGGFLTVSGSVNNNGTFKISAISGDELTLTLDDDDVLANETVSSGAVVSVASPTMRGNPGITFDTDNNGVFDLFDGVDETPDDADGQDTDVSDIITRTAGSFVDDGFEAGMVVEVFGSSANNGSFLVQTVSNAELLLDPIELLKDSPDAPGDPVEPASETGVTIFRASVQIRHNPELTFEHGGSDTITRADGSFVHDGFEVGQSIEVYGSAVNNGVYTVTGLTDTVMTVAEDLVSVGLTDDPELTFSDTGGENDTIARADGSFIDDGFVAGMRIRVSGTTDNDGVFKVLAVTDDTLTLSFGSRLKDEVVASGASITENGVGAVSRVTGKITMPELYGQLDQDVYTVTVDQKLPTEGEGLKGATFLITRGPGIGQERPILANTDHTISFRQPFRTPLTADTVFEIHRYDNLAIPIVSVAIEDNDTASVVITETSGSTRVMEGAADGQGGLDTYKVVLTRAPEMGNNVTITLVNDDGELALSSTAPGATTNGQGQLVLTFTNGNWSTPQEVKVRTKNTEARPREGLHRGFIQHIVNGGGDHFKTELNNQVVPITAQRVVATIGDDEVPTVIVEETGGSTDVVEGSSGGAQSYRKDSYSVVLSRAPEGGKLSGNPNLTFANVGDADTIQRSAGSWITNGFKEGDLIRVSGSASNNGIFKIASLTATVLTLTGDASLTNEGPVGGVDVDGALVKVNVRPEGTRTTRGNVAVHPQNYSPSLATDAQLTFFQFFGINFIGRDTGSWEAEGFAAGQHINIDGSTSNDGAFVIAGVGDKLMTVVEDVTGETGPKGLVSVKAEETIANVQVAVSSTVTDAVSLADGSLDLYFDDSNWSTAQTIDIVAIDDAAIDGMDTQEFAPIANIVNKFKGPLFVEGQGGSGSLAGLNIDPLRLPSETNLKDSVGEVLPLPMGYDPATFIRVDAEALALLGADKLATATLEITRGTGTGQVRLVVGYTQLMDGTALLELDKPWDIVPDPIANPDPVIEYAVSETNPNFLVQEFTQNDLMLFHNQDSVADDLGSLSSVIDQVSEGDRERFRIQGINMGPELHIAGFTVDGGINFYDLETVSMFLGSGSDALTVDATPTRADDPDTPEDETYRVTTLIYTNLGDDEVTVDLQDGEDGFFALDVGGRITKPSVETDDDTVNASTSSLPLVIFGGDGDDDITGGSGNDILFGDRGRVDYRAEDDVTLVTRLGTGAAYRTPADPLGTITGQVDSIAGAVITVATLTDVKGNPIPDDLNIEDGGLRGLRLFINGGAGFGQSRLILSNTADTITLDEAFEDDPMFGLPDETSLFRITGVPSDQTDGLFRDPSLVLAYDREIGGVDTVHGGGGEDLIFGGFMGDFLFGDGASDLIFGDAGRITFSPPDVDGKTMRRKAETFSPELGGGDTISGGAGTDVMLGGADGDTIYGDNLAGSSGAADLGDIILGDHGELLYDVDLDLTTLDLIRTTETALGGADTVHGNAGDDTILGGTAGDRLSGDQDDDLLLGDFAHLVILGGTIVSAEMTDRTLGGSDTMFGGADDDILAGGAFGDRIDGDAGDDLILGDNAHFVRSAIAGDTTSPRFRALLGTIIYGAQGQDLVNHVNQYNDPRHVPAWALWDFTMFDHSFAAEAAALTNFGDDYIAGGGNDDTIFGQLGDDIIQGDGSIDSLDMGGPGVSAYRDVQGDLILAPSFESVDDGDDYIEGNGGSDVVFGGLGQDDIIGGSSELFSLPSRTLRPDGDDLIFGGAGTHAGRNDNGDLTADGHGRDADVILGDNGNIFRLVGLNGAGGSAYLTFNYDNYNPSLRIVPRAAQLLDYTPGGADFNPAGTANDIGASDEIHGESGDDAIYGQRGGDVLFGDGQDDDLIGGYGNDWISGGTGQDGILGDDGRISTSRNGLTEPLYGLTTATVQETISTPGNVQQAIINVTGQLKKVVNLEPYNVDPAEDELFAPVLTPSDDILFGGTGGDWLHGGMGDDAISGAEALGLAYIQAYDGSDMLIGVVRSDFDRPFNPGNMLRFNPDDPDAAHFDPTRRAGEFALYDEYDALRQILLTDGGALSKTGSGKAFALNFSSNEGVPVSDPTYGIKQSDGNDALFGDLGNDWLVGGTGRDNMWGGWGNDLMNADDLLETSGGLNNLPDTHPSYEDRAFGGAGRDVLQGNTGGDRLIDWVGEFNSYIVPFSPFGVQTVSRALQPALPGYLYALSAGDGADPTRAADTGADPARNGEPRGEIGLMLQKDAD